MKRKTSTIIQRWSLLPIMAVLLLAGCAESVLTDTADIEAQEGSAALQRVAPAADAAVHTYSVTVENLTDGQPFSPGVLAAHTRKASFFRIGTAASEGLRLIAEAGDPSTAAAELMQEAGVFDVVATPVPVPPGGEETFEVEAKANADRLSMAAMLVCTNDGFTGLDAVKLPGGFEEATYYAGSYDAGTEANEETSETIVDGCGLGMDGNARTATAVPIAPHPGILGVGDLDPEQHGWTDPVARITIRRLE